MTKKDGCVFCDFKDRDVVIWQDDLCYAIISKNPINHHHVLVIPNEHIQDFVKLPDELASHIFLVAKKLSLAVRKACNPDAITHVFDDDASGAGYNLVAHYKLHIIPRFKKDMHLIDWSPMRPDEADESRATYAQDVKRNIPTSSQ
jgi:histidine triad (HIT) family protein